MSPPIEDRMRQKAALEQTRPGAHAGNSQREPSDPPGVGSDYLERIEKHARWWEAGKKILAAVVVVGGIVAGAIAWGLSRPSKSDVDAAESRATAAASAKNDQIQKLTERSSVIETKIDDHMAEENRRWDKLDRILEKQFGDTTSATPPPAFGPAARRQGRQ